MLTIEVTTSRRIIVACGGQRKPHQFRKSNSKTHSTDYAILIRLADWQEWRNPPAGTPENEAMRKQFYRFREALGSLIPIPGDAFFDGGR